MQNITLDELQPGMYLSRPLLAEDGTVLLHEGIEVRERYIQYLRDQGITSLFIGADDKKAFASDDTEVDIQRYKQQTAEAAQGMVQQFRVGKGVQLDGLKSVIGDMIQQLSQKPENMIYLLDLRRKAEYMFSHGINTCILSIMTGLSLGYSTEQLNDLGMAAMLHDIGKTKFSKQLAVQFHHHLTVKDREEYKRHPFYSLEILKANPAISMDVMNACFQHHERWNGSGYPMGIGKNLISEYAQIISIADVYDRLLVGLPHRRPTPVYYAVAILNKAAGEFFNPAIVDVFTQNVAIYPMGKAVVLNTQQRGVILGVGIKNKTTPIIRITADKDGKPTDQPMELDLLKNPEVFIVDFEDQYFSYAQAYADHAYINTIKRPVV